MEQNQQNQLNDYELKRQQRIKEQQVTQRKIRVKKIATTLTVSILITVPIAGLIWYMTTRPPTPETDVISKKGLHWHPELSIEIKGKKQEIPANIGIGAVHSPIHTHDTSGILHLEMQGLVTKNSTKLIKFFKIWDKQFNSNCILDSCNGTDGTVRMFVNGKENMEFENYQMQDKDKIEIKYE